MHLTETEEDIKLGKSTGFSLVQAQLLMKGRVR